MWGSADRRAPARSLSPGFVRTSRPEADSTRRGIILMNSKADKVLFWGCFIALITTSTAFITRAILVNTVWPAEFGLDAVRSQELFGAGIWPFAISIILFSLVIDR